MDLFDLSIEVVGEREFIGERIRKIKFECQGRAYASQGQWLVSAVLHSGSSGRRITNWKPRTVSPLKKT